MGLCPTPLPKQEIKVRTALKVDKEKFVQSVQEAEKDGPLENRHQLYSRVADLYNAKIGMDMPQISFSVASLRISEYALEIKTPLGKKGKPKPKEFSSELTAPIPNGFDISKLKPAFSKKYHSLIDNLGNGCVKSAIFLKCLECMGENEIEITECECQDCPNWHFRPFQRKT